MVPVNVAEVSATGDVVSVSQGQTLILAWARLVAGAGAAATAIIRETDGSGRVIGRLAALQGTSDGYDVETPVFPSAGTVKMHVTLSGAGAVCQVGYR